MKKICIVTNKLVIGGIEKALIEMIKLLPEDKFDISLLYMEDGGDFKEFIPSYVKIEKAIQYNSFKEIIKKYIETKDFRGLYRANINFIKLKLNNNWMEQNIYSTKMQPQYKQKYDIVIAYSTPISKIIPYVINNTNSENKVMWIHSDVDLFKKEMSYYNEYYRKYNKIFCVSQEVKEKFDRLYPDIKNRTEVFYNIISQDKIKKLSEQGETFNDKFEGTRILTVARLTDEKGHDFIPGILRKLLDEGLNVKWYCIGDGILKKDIKIKIKNSGLDDRYILLGIKVNPYKYMKDCDIYVQPSKYECYCTTITEAKCLNKPIIFTNVNGAKEQIISEVNGLITEYDEEKLYKAIKRLIQEKELRDKFSQNLSKDNISTEKEINKLISII